MAAPGQAATYDPSDILLVVANVLITGYADGTFIQIEEQSDGITSSVGADSEVARSISPDPRIRIRCTLMQTSTSNDWLTGLYAADRYTGSAMFSVLLKDLRGTTLIASSQAWIVKMPTVSFAKTADQHREWTIEAVRVGTSMYIVGGTPR